LKVLIISHSYAAAENRKNVAALARHAEVRCVVPHYVYDRVLGSIESPTISTGTYLVGRRLSLPRSQYLLASRDLSLREFQPDIIHIEYDPWTTIFWQACLARARYAKRARIVCTVKKNTFRPLPTPLHNIKVGIARQLLGQAAHVIVVNEGVRRIYSKHFSFPERQMTTMQHLGIDLGQFNPLSTRATKASIDRLQNDGARKLVVGYCGRLDANKGVLDLVKAFAALPLARTGKACLRLIGRGDLSAELTARGEPWLEVLSPVPHAEVVGFMQGLDLFVMPSLITPDHEEHDGHAIMEAMACGVATIGSTSGIIPELLANGCGKTFAAGDQNELADALTLLLSNPKLRGEFASHARDRAAESFSVEAIAARKALLYAEVLQ